MFGMKRRQFITVLGGAAAAWPMASRAQQQDRPRQVAILFGGFSESDPEPRARIKAFKEQLQELGWTDGGNIRVQARMGRGRPDQVRAYAAELVGMMPDVLAANSGPALAALLRETRTIPIVFASILDPVVSSLTHPGGNATGFASLDPAITGKWLELLKEIAPKITRVAAISDRDNQAAYAGFVRAMRDLAPSLGVEFKSDPVANLEDIERAIDSISSTPGGGLALMGTVASANRESIVRLSPAACRRFINSAFMRAREGSSHMGRTALIFGAEQACTSIASCAVQNQPTCRCRCRPSTNWSSTSRPPGHSASLCLRRYSPVPMR
jgi:putative tryptophan/tyrosine transport system substrate-binding protein